MEYTEEQLKKIDDELKAIGVIEYRFCIENNQYVCDTQGNIYSVYARNRYGGGKIRIYKRKLKLHEGYYQVTLDCADHHGSHFVHRMIANAFWGEHKGLVVNHKNGQPNDNRIENLEFVTQQENMLHGHRWDKQRIYDENILFWYLLYRYYNMSIFRISKIFFSTRQSVEGQIASVELILKHIEFTKDQIEKCMNKMFNSDNRMINKELLKKYLKEGDENARHK